MTRKIAFLASLAAVFVLTLGAAWIFHALRSPYYCAPEPEVFVEIPRGSGAGEAARLLAEAGVVRHPLPFMIHVRRHNLAGRIQAGDYRFSQPATPAEVADRLVRGDVFYRSVTLPEGLTAWEVVDRLVQAGLGTRDELARQLLRIEWIRDLAPRAATLEGFLFPDTYRLGRHSKPEQVVRAMVQRFRNRWSELAGREGAPGRADVFTTVILASLIEKEAGRPDEKPLVSSVLTNRLNRGIPLGCDPTIIYALKLEGRFDGNLRKTDLSLDSPYNTYRRAGLPPGPITNPGIDSLRAALEPAATDLLYYVSRNDGSHEFSKHYAAHARAVGRWQKPRPSR